MIDSDLKAYEAHQRVVELATSVNPKVAKIQAKRDVTVARTKSSDYQVARAVIAFFVLVAVMVMTVGGCTAYIDGPLNQDVTIMEQQVDQKNMETCLQAEGEYSADTNYCDLDN